MESACGSGRREYVPALPGQGTYAGTWIPEGEQPAGSLDLHAGQRPIGVLKDASESCRSGWVHRGWMNKRV